MRAAETSAVPGQHLIKGDWGTMRTIEVGAVKIHLQEGEEAVSMLEALLRPLSNKEVAAMIGISERTVMRWKQAGRLPARERAKTLDPLRPFLLVQYRVQPGVDARRLPSQHSSAGKGQQLMAQVL